MSILITLLTIVEVLICLLLILIIMMQRPRQEGLGASFGSGVMDQIAGVQTTNVLQKGTAWLAGAMFVTTILLAALVAKKDPKTKAVFDTKPVAAAEAKATDAKPATAEAGKTPAPATNGPAMKLTPGGAASTSPIINVQPPAAGTATKLPNGAGTVIVKPATTIPAAPAPAVKPAPAPAPSATTPAATAKPEPAAAAPASAPAAPAPQK